MKNKSKLKQKMKDLDKVVFGIFLYSSVGNIISQTDYKNIEKSAGFEHYQNISSEIYSLNNFKERASFLKESKHYVVSGFDCNFSNLEDRINSLELKRDSLENTQRFVDYRKEQKHKKKTNDLFFYPSWLSLFYFTSRFLWKGAGKISSGKEENET